MYYNTGSIFVPTEDVNNLHHRYDRIIGLFGERHDLDLNCFGFVPKQITRFGGGHKNTESVTE